VFLFLWQFFNSSYSAYQHQLSKISVFVVFLSLCSPRYFYPTNPDSQKLPDNALIYNNVHHNSRVILVLWQFFIPLVIFVVAYWKILGVVRRQTNVAPSRQRRAATSRDPGQPVAETSMVTLEQANTGPGSDKDKSQERKEKVHESKAGGQNGPKNKQLSHAQINVVRTMVYITVCFTLCWMPMYLYYLLSTFEVHS